MIELTHGIKLFKHRSFVEWHAPFSPQKFAGVCPDGNCPWMDHFPENSEHDPLCITDLLLLQPGTRMLILADYCERWYVSYLTLASIFEPNGATQFRFAERSSASWYFRPDPAGPGHMLYLDSIRYLAVVQSETLAFGKDGKLPCFMRELSRIGNMDPEETQKAMQLLEDSIPKTFPVILKPWQMQAATLLDHLYAGDTSKLIEELGYLLSFPGGHYPASIFFAVVAQRGKLQELNATLGKTKTVVFPGDFGNSITLCIDQVSRHCGEINERAKNWWADLEKLFGIRRASI